MTSSPPAWSQQFDADVLGPVSVGLPHPVTRAWAWAGADGAGIKVAVIDSGVDGSHPAVGQVAGGVSVEVDGATGDVVFNEGPHEDVFGHGTACAGIIRRAAPAAAIYSVRVLGSTLKGTGAAFSAGIRWALDNGMHVLNLSLSTRNPAHFGPLHALIDEAYFKGVIAVGAVNNVEAPSYPTEYAAVLSVAAQAARPGEAYDPLSFACNPSPPVEFGAPGIDVDVPWLNGQTMQVTGNSFAAAHLTGVVARILSKHPGMTPYQMKTVLRALAVNAAPGTAL